MTECSRVCMVGSLVFAFSVLAGCVSPAVYAPRDGGSTGYTDQQLSATRWRITFAGNSATPRQTVENYLLLRAAQVTEQAGYGWFVIDTRDTEADKRYFTEFEGPPGWGFHRHFGWYWGGFDYAETYPALTRYNAYAEIVLLTPAQAKAEPRALEARDVIAHVGLPPAANR